ncbi:MAG: diacylglycerol/polyprenol kinase family protein [Dehalococcoidia bacterium]
MRKLSVWSQAARPAEQSIPWGRRLFHLVAGSSIPLLGIFLAREVMVPLLAALSAVAVLLEVLRFALPGLNRLLVGGVSVLLKETETRRVTGATYMALAALLAFLVFDKPVAVLGLLFLSLGDPVAAMVGRRAPGSEVAGKSLWGTGAFFLMALAAAGLLSQTGVIEPHWALLVGAGVAALVEFLPLPLDDNVTVPLVSGVVMAMLL